MDTLLDRLEEEVGCNRVSLQLTCRRCYATWTITLPREVLDHPEAWLLDIWTDCRTCRHREVLR